MHCQRPCSLSMMWRILRRSKVYRFGLRSSRYMNRVPLEDR